MTTASKTVSDVIHSHLGVLTRAEKQLAESLLDNYPVSGLGSITTIAENVGVSTPTGVRLVQKLGFKGYPDFQERLHLEVEATISNPIAKHDRWAQNAPGTHILNRFADAIMGN
ncbi:MurR/RpiR family transcriptional regulator, partial [Rhizobium phaseoli]